MSLGINNLKVCLDSVEKLIASGMVVMEDGKISLGDATEIPALFRAISALAASVPQAMDEVKDLNLEEAQELIKAALALIAKVAEAIQKNVE